MVCGMLHSIAARIDSNTHKILLLYRTQYRSMRLFVTVLIQQCVKQVLIADMATRLSSMGHWHGHACTDACTGTVCREQNQQI